MHNPDCPLCSEFGKPRFVIVRVAKYTGMYRKQDPLAWAIADREKANSIVSGKFTDEKLAQDNADEMNADYTEGFCAHL